MRIYKISINVLKINSTASVSKNLILAHITPKPSISVSTYSVVLKITWYLTQLQQRSNLEKQLKISN